MLSLRAIICVFLLLASAPWTESMAEAVDVELVLAADGSGSIDDDEFRLQRAGYAAAITAPDVLKAIASGVHGAIAVTLIEWGGPASQHSIVDWTVISGAASARAFAGRLLAAPRQASGYNSISAAIAFSAELIRANAFEARRKIIDLSGDGPQFGGPPLEQARRDALAAGIVINAIVVRVPGAAEGGGAGLSLVTHYRRDVIGGDGAFVMTADGRARFADALRRKLILEIASPVDQ